MTEDQLAKRRAREARRRAEQHDERVATHAARLRGMHLRTEGMVTACGVRLDVERAKAARFTDDAATLRRAANACEVCARKARR